MKQLGKMIVVSFVILTVVLLPVSSQNAAAAGTNDFQAAVSYPVGRNPVSAAVGDFNGDGKLDVAVVNSGDNTVSVLLGNGDGTFQAPVNYAVGNFPVSVVVGDFNQDGKQDLAVANQSSQSISLLLGNGDGTFQAAVNTPLAFRPVALAVVQPGIIAVTHSDQNAVSVFHLFGNQFAQIGNDYFIPGFFLGESSLLHNSIAVGDFNGDGLPDLAVTTEDELGNTYVSLLRGNSPSPTFLPVGNFHVGIDINGSDAPPMAVGDFNGDGRMDVVVSNTSDFNVGVLLNDAGFFSPGSQVKYPVGRFPRSVVTGDFNGDDYLDLAVANSLDNTVSVLHGDGVGTFQAAVNYPVGPVPVFMAVGDFNGDGRSDLVVVNSGDNTVTVLLASPPTPPGVPVLNGPNTFTGNQTVNGTLSASSFSGNGTGLTNVTASGLNCAGCVGNVQLAVNYAGSSSQGGPATAAVSAGLASNALALGGQLPGFYATTGANAFVGDQNVMGNLATTGTVAIGNAGTPITKHLSLSFNPIFPALKPGTCASMNFTFSGASDGDTLALGVPNSRTTGGGTLSYFAWVSANDTITMRACSIATDSPQKTPGTGAIRVDLWKH